MNLKPGSHELKTGLLGSVEMVPMAQVSTVVLEL